MNDTFVPSTRQPVVCKNALLQGVKWRRFERNEALYAARTYRQWSLLAASSRVGASSGAYSDWERGRALPQRHWLYALCTTFQLPPADLGFPITILPYVRLEDHELSFVGQRCEPLFEQRLATGKIACDLAEEIGVETREYLAWELGQAIPSSEQLNALYGVFDCAPQALGFSQVADRVQPEQPFGEPATAHMTLNVLLCQVRKQRGWSKARAAQSVGVGVTTYRYWETGRCIPSLQHLRRLCQVFQLPQDQLGYPILLAETPHLGYSDVAVHNVS